MDRCAHIFTDGDLPGIRCDRTPTLDCNFCIGCQRLDEVQKQINEDDSEFRHIREEIGKLNQKICNIEYEMVSSYESIVYYKCLYFYVFHYQGVRDSNPSLKQYMNDKCGELKNSVFRQFAIEDSSKRQVWRHNNINDEVIEERLQKRIHERNKILNGLIDRARFLFVIMILV